MTHIAIVTAILEAMTSVCSVGFDMIAVPGDTPASTLSAIIADEMAIGVVNKKTTASESARFPERPSEIRWSSAAF